MTEHKPVRWSRYFYVGTLLGAFIGASLGLLVMAGFVSILCAAGGAQKAGYMLVACCVGMIVLCEQVGAR